MENMHTDAHSHEKSKRIHEYTNLHVPTSTRTCTNTRARKRTQKHTRVQTKARRNKHLRAHTCKIYLHALAFKLA